MPDMDGKTVAGEHMAAETVEKYADRISWRNSRHDDPLRSSGTDAVKGELDREAPEGEGVTGRGTSIYLPYAQRISGL